MVIKHPLVWVFLLYLFVGHTYTTSVPLLTSCTINLSCLHTTQLPFSLPFIHLPSIAPSTFHFLGLNDTVYLSLFVRDVVVSHGAGRPLAESPRRILPRVVVPRPSWCHFPHTTSISFSPLPPFSFLFRSLRLCRISWSFFKPPSLPSACIILQYPPLLRQPLLHLNYLTLTSSFCHN